MKPTLSLFVHLFFKQFVNSNTDYRYIHFYNTYVHNIVPIFIEKNIQQNDNFLKLVIITSKW